MKIELHPGDPRGLDKLHVDALVVPLYERCAQPLGVAGSIDWRLCGRIGRLLKGGQFSGKEGESVLTTVVGRFGVERLFLFGLGSPALKKNPMPRIVELLEKAAAKEVAIAPPELPDAPPPLDVLAAWLAAPELARAKIERLLILDAGTIAAGSSKLRAAGSALNWA